MSEISVAKNGQATLTCEMPDDTYKGTWIQVCIVLFKCLDKIFNKKRKKVLDRLIISVLQVFYLKLLIVFLRK